jgi:calcineurin-like phosphoesterase family protein
MNDYILTRWNTRVTNADTVYILGDIALRGSNGPLIGLVSQLKGKKILVRGNHDDIRDYRYALLFDEIVHYAELTENVNGKAYNLCLMHYPILMWKNQHRGTILLYGHTHNSVENTFFQDCIHRMNESEELNLRRHGGQRIRAINVGACMPYMNYTPRTLKEILEAPDA